MFKRILVANRGEIAMRILRSCREMGIESVAVYSDADANALHIVNADYAERLPGVSPAETYLDMGKIIDVCKKYQADALHPGYGFLAENADFAQACRDNGIVFIGPTPQAIRDLGNKVKAKQIARSAGVPVVPGTDGPVRSIDEALAFANTAGYPLMLKAAAGGGGRGMRVVHSAEELPHLLQTAMNEALGAFGSDEIFIERCIEHAKHIEFQILADEHGNLIHLCERDCSIQRRHQKLIEEAPSTALTPELRAEMGAVAIKMARAANYTNAGTVEFLLDPDGNYYFMEMNTRLQVEHTVTEMVTFIDHVRAQILIATGEPLHRRQEDVVLRGWCIQARINAEDPLRGFLPSVGKLNRYIPPAGGGIRLDSCAYEGYTIPRDYDNMVAKLITFGWDRERAMAKMRRALKEFIITGVRTTIPFHRFVFEHPEFVGGKFHTGFVEQRFNDEQVAALLRTTDEQQSVDQVALAAALYYYLERTDVIAGNKLEDTESGRQWQIVNRIRNSNYLPG
jgi:acetyl-CoA carboxylase, biotin carboxylase subunit